MKTRNDYRNNINAENKSTSIVPIDINISIATITLLEAGY
jgi:hypothetical protein